jgi:hypothetical protein
LLGLGLKCLKAPKGLGVHAPKREKVHIAGKWDRGGALCDP